MEILQLNYNLRGHTMKLVIEINMDGAAFEGDPICEATRILKKEIGKGGEFAMNLILDRSVNLRDINGNICGSVTVEE
jgi:hypothetical protein